ncbi:GumC family protein [Telmatobacter bradus]|uniref:GumC family protein n=1 Tax=Telmatobacter bradus TaxID=474953 RepID=UPI003B42FA66
MDIWRTLSKQRYTILVVTIICVASAAYYAFHTKPVYDSVARIEIKPNESPNLGFESLTSEHKVEANSEVATELRILQSDSVLLQTAQNLNILQRTYGVAAKNIRASNGGLEVAPVDRVRMIKTMRRGLQVTQLLGTNIVEIHYRGSDPRLDTDIVNKLVESYSDADLRAKYERSMHVSDWLQKQMNDLQQSAADSQRKLVDFQKQYNIVGSDENSNLTLQSLTQISSELETAQSDRIAKEERLREFKNLSPDMVALLGDNQSLGILRTQLNDLKSQRAQLASKYGDSYPRMRELNVQIDKLQNTLKQETDLSRSQIQKEYDAAVGLEQTLRKRLQDQEDASYKLNENVAQFEILRHEAEQSRELYDHLQTRLKESSVLAGLSAANISIIDRAQVPVYPVEPRKAASLLAGFFGGLLAGCVVAFVVESIDDRLQTSEEAESVSHLPSLATVPHIQDDTQKKKRFDLEEMEDSKPNLLELTVLSNPKSMAAESYRGLRSSLLLSSIDKPPRLIVLTSAFPGEGKTTTAVNCAVVLAQRGERVLLIDGDLRRGTLDRVFGIDGKTFGLSTVLAKPGSHFDLPAPLPELPTLHVLPTGPRPPNPAEMLSSQRMIEQLKLWSKEFDRIVIDTAPVLAVSDTPAVGALADAVVLVVRAGYTRRRALIRARDLLWRMNIPITGVVVNDVDMRLENFYTYRYGMYGYRYGYSYRYGSSYYTDLAYGYEEDENNGEKNA